MLTFHILENAEKHNSIFICKEKQSINSNNLDIKMNSGW